MITYLLSLTMYLIYLFLKSKKSLHMLQQNRYNRGNKYLKWLKQNISKNFLNIEIIIFILPLFNFLDIYLLALIFNTTYFIFILLYLLKTSKEIVKIPLNITGRIKRLFITNILIYITIILILKPSLYTYYLLAILMYFNNIVILIGNIINLPIEKLINKHYKDLTKEKLKSLKNLQVIGITGSYGKTSSKNILNTILNVKYNVLESPKNYNTPLGLMITVNEYLDKFNDYFIAEMGACKPKEIKELCDLVNPKYGILTKIGLSHLETFKTIENITKTKFELIESLPKDGVGILNADDDLQVDYKLKNKVKIVWIGIDNKEKADIYAENIILNANGTTFDCYFKKQKIRVTFTTKLLGKNNIYNILSSIALGWNLGMSIDELVMGIKKVMPVEHRLNIKKYYNMHLIDDAYNANIEGSKMALDVLNLMKGKKIVVTSGIIELGNKNFEINNELGKYMSTIVDKAILIGEKQTKPIYKGLIEKGFKKDNILVFNNIEEVFKYLRNLNELDAYILLQSDLPDIFNER